MSLQALVYPSLICTVLPLSFEFCSAPVASSGTTFGFTDYLSRASTQWTLGRGTSIQWPLGTIQGQGNPGVVSAVVTTANSIGYTDFGLVLANNLATANMQNQATIFVPPTLAGCEAAAGQVPSFPLGENMAAWSSVSINNQPGASVYPICTFVYFMVNQNLQSAGLTGLAVSTLVTFLLGPEAQTSGARGGYAALPASLVAANARTLSLLQLDPSVTYRVSDYLLPEPPTQAPVATTAPPSQTTPAPTTGRSAAVGLRPSALVVGTLVAVLLAHAAALLL